MINNDLINVIQFISRRKDNKSVTGYTRRKKTIVSDKPYEHHLKEFEQFVEQGVPGEMSRMYVTINPRSKELLRKALIHELVDDNIDIINIGSKLASIAMRPECASKDVKSRWLFDFDPVDEPEYDIGKHVEQFIEDLQVAFSNTRGTTGELTVELHKTVNGYAVIPDKKFYKQEVLKKYPNVDDNKDMLLYTYKRKDTKQL